MRNLTATFQESGETLYCTVHLLISSRNCLVACSSSGVSSGAMSGRGAVAGSIPPPPGQGIGVAVAREEDGWLVDLLKKASDPRAAVEAAAEREFLRHVGAGCHVAVGGLAISRDGGIEFIAGFAHGGRRYLVKVFGDDPLEVGRRAAEEVKKVWRG